MRCRRIERRGERDSKVGKKRKMKEILQSGKTSTQPLTLCFTCSSSLFPIHAKELETRKKELETVLSNVAVNRASLILTGCFPTDVEMKAGLLMTLQTEKELVCIYTKKRE
jgi:hypothetical protein